MALRLYSTLKYLQPI